MLKPTGMNLLIKPYYDVSSDIAMPEGYRGKFFEVLAVGDGYITETAEIVPLEIKIGDIVAVEGKILELPFKGERYLICRAVDVLAYERNGWTVPDKI